MHKETAASIFLASLTTVELKYFCVILIFWNGAKNEISMISLKKNGYFKLSFLSESDLRISCNKGNGGNCKNLTLFKKTKQQYLPHHWTNL